MKKPSRQQLPPPEETDIETTMTSGPLNEVTGELAQTGEKTSFAIALTRAEVDQQITTARAYPRSIQTASERITSLATLDEETAIECVYELPRGGKIIKGESIRFAEICASQWGNQRNAARVVHVDRFEKFVEAEGIFHDLETGSVTVSRVRRRIFDQNGRLYNDDMIMVTGQAACSIARRNAILAGIPKGVYRRAYQAALEVIKGDQKTLVERREGALKAFNAMGVTNERVFNALGVKGLQDIDLDELAELTAMRAAIKKGEAKVDQLFPEPKKEEPAPKDTRGKLEALSGASGGSPNAAAASGGTKAPDRPAGGEQSPTPPAGDLHDGRHMGDPTNPPPDEGERDLLGDRYPDQEEIEDETKND